MATTLPANTTATRSTERLERFDAIVVGAGQAGLAVGHQLARREVDFVIVDGDARVGDAWRRRWDSLRLFTPAKYSALPGMPFPAPPGHLPDKDEVADYLERYAERFDLPTRTGTRVERVAHDGARFAVDAGGRRLQAESVVVATGAFQRPRVPAFAARLDPAIHQLHSSAYRNPFALPDGPALVVGVGNSGAQVAIELARFRPTWLAGREKGHLPRRVLGRDLYDWTWPIARRVAAESRLGRRMRARTAGGDPLVGMHPREITDAGVRRVGRVTGVEAGLPVCDGQRVNASVIVWCTGFAPDFAWLDMPVLDAAGEPRHRGGVATDVDGLYFMGLRWQRRLASSLLGGVGADAAVIAERVAARHGSMSDA
jgi:putative flavoprotein involved in K+ transport